MRHPGSPSLWALQTFRLDREHARDVAGLLAMLLLLILWELGGLDLRITRWFGTARGFGWSHHWLTASVLHDGVKYAAWLLAIVLAVGIWRPVFAFKALTQGQRLWLILTAIGAAMLISWLRRHSVTSCPWELREFGGTVADYVPHWRPGTDRGPGQCFPSGHASTAFALLPGWLALRRSAPRFSRAWLLVVVGMGVLLGWVQVMRGAHFVSHWIWTGWLCAAFTIAMYHSVPCWRREHPRRGLAGQSRPQCRTRA